jgi:hypothetical protein
MSPRAMSPVSTSTIDGSSEDILRVIGRRNDAARSPERAQRRHAPRYRILRHVDQFGGDEQIFNRHKSVLDAMGDQAAHIGPSGAGTIAKFVHNCISAVLGAALAEVFTMGVKAGVDPVDLWAAVRQGATGRVRTFDRLGDRFLQGKHDPADFALRLLHKDVGLAVGLGREVGVPMRLANLVYEELTEAMNRGWGARNSTVGQLLQVERAGIEPLAADPERIAAVREADKQK